MRKMLIAIVLLGAVISSFGVLKIAQGLEAQNQVLYSAETFLSSGQATPALFVPDQSGSYEGPCTAVCQGGKTGTLLFSSIR